MNFKGHLYGGLAAGATGIAIGASLGGLPRLGTIQLHPLGDSEITWILTFGMGLFMGLFPDLDVASKPQRWYFRFALLLLLFLFHLEEWLLLSFLAGFSFLPLLHQHRGWTHQLWAPWLLCFGCLWMMEVYRAEQSWFFGFSWDNLSHPLQQGWPWLLSGILGHYTHLLLDSKLVLGLRSRGHY